MVIALCNHRIMQSPPPCARLLISPRRAHLTPPVNHHHPALIPRCLIVPVHPTPAPPPAPAGETPQLTARSLVARLNPPLPASLPPPSSCAPARLTPPVNQKPALASSTVPAASFLSYPAGRPNAAKPPTAPSVSWPATTQRHTNHTTARARLLYRSSSSHPAPTHPFLLPRGKPPHLRLPPRLCYPPTSHRQQGHPP